MHCNVSGFENSRKLHKSEKNTTKVFGGTKEWYQNNTIFGGPNDDEDLIGLDREDTIDGGPGFDVLYGGNGNDYLTGGPGNDLFYPGMDKYNLWV